MNEEEMRKTKEGTTAGAWLLLMEKLDLHHCNSAALVYTF